jgi:hypothetical protein
MKDHICGKVVDWCICGTTKILFCIYCREVVGYQKKDEDIRVSISIVADLMTDREQKEYDTQTLEANK